jgi:hypothetical protein
MWIDSEILSFWTLSIIQYSSVSHSDQVRIFTAVESSYRSIFNKQKATRIRKFSLLYNQQIKVSSTSASDSKKSILNLSKHVLTDSEEAVLMNTPT